MNIVKTVVAIALFMAITCIVAISIAGWMEWLYETGY